MELQQQSVYQRRFKMIRNHLHASQCPNGKKIPPVRVLVTGAAGQIGYALNFMIAQGRMFGQNQSVILHLFDLPNTEQILKGVAMELNDGAFDLLKGIVVTTDPAVGFKDIDFGVFCGARPRGPGMERKDLLVANSKIFEDQGSYLEKYAKKTVKVVVVGNPANTNCLILSKNAPSINVNNFTALTRLDQNRMVSQLSERLKVETVNIHNGIIWGNHSATQYPDVNHSIIDYGEFSLPAKSAVSDDKWLQTDFIKTVQQRGAEIIKARKLSSAASAASAACDHIRDWFLGTKDGKWVSMGVYSRGEYGVPSDIIYSFPVVCKNGEWNIVLDLKVDEFSRKKMTETADELLQEKAMATSKK